MRTRPDPTPRVKLLKAARRKVKKGEQFNAEDMARVAGMTWRHMKPQVEADAEWPVERRGSEGVAWLFDGRKVLDHMIARLEAEQRARLAKSERMARMSGNAIAAAAASTEHFSVAELVKLDQLQTSAHRRKIEQGEYVRAAEVAEVLTGVFTTMQSEVLAIASRLDPAGRWPAGVRAEVADAMRTVLVRTHDQVAGWLTDDVRPEGRPRNRARNARN